MDWGPPTSYEEDWEATSSGAGGGEGRLKADTGPGRCRLGSSQAVRQVHWVEPRSSLSAAPELFAPPLGVRQNEQGLF